MRHGEIGPDLEVIVNSIAESEYGRPASGGPCGCHRFKIFRMVPVIIFPKGYYIELFAPEIFVPSSITHRYVTLITRSHEVRGNNLHDFWPECLRVEHTQAVFQKFGPVATVRNNNTYSHSPKIAGFYYPFSTKRVIFFSVVRQNVVLCFN